MTDRQAMLDIQSAMSGKEWNADTLDEIAEIMRRSGYAIEGL